MALEISKQAIQFVSNFKPEELRDVRIYLNSTSCHDHLREIHIEDGSLSPLEIMILDRIKSQHENMRIQILARIDQVLAGTRAA